MRELYDSTAHPNSAAWRSANTLVQLLRFRALNNPEGEAFTFLSDAGESVVAMTYQELDRRVRAVACALQSRNLAGERALLLYPPGLEYITAFFGCLYAGVVAVPAYPPRRSIWS